jgi:hypothetical protein
MKKIVILLMMFIGVTSFSQRGERAERGHYMKNMSPEQVATLQTKKMTLHLDLSAEQQNQIMAINLENAKMRKAKMAERKARKEEGEMKKPTSEERYAMANKMLDLKIAQKAEMKKILTETQFAKWEKMHNRRGKARKGMKGKAKKHMKTREKN